MDRSYPARGWLGQLVEPGRFCARMPEHWGRSKPSCAVPPTMPGVAWHCQRPPTLRLLRFVLPRGTCLVLVIITMLDETLSPEDFAALYRERWRIEEAFKLIRRACGSRTAACCLTVEQDFCATLVRNNCAAALAGRSPEEASLGTPPINARGWRKPQPTRWP